jgi:hypothetical protein
MSVLDLDLVFWNQMLMRSMHLNIHTYTYMHQSQISYAAAQDIHWNNWKYGTSKLGFLHTQKNFSENYPQCVLKNFTSPVID